MKKYKRFGLSEPIPGFEEPSEFPVPNSDSVLPQEPTAEEVEKVKLPTVTERLEKYEFERWTPKMQLILSYELCGWDRKRMLKVLEISSNTLTSITKSEIYLKHRSKALAELEERLLAKKVEEAVGDPVIVLFKQKALAAAKAKIKIMEKGKSEFARNAAASEVLDRAGYKVETKRITTSVEVTEEMASRWDRVLNQGTPKVVLKIEETNGS